MKLCGLLLSLKSDDPVANGAFVAPEMYDDEHEVDPAVDIYALGLCLLQMLTGQQPYVECEKAHHLFKKVTNGHPPDALALVTDQGAIELIEACLRRSDQRPSAKELQSFSFLEVRYH